jgi:DNA-binding response OmpR family regulator
MNNPLIVVVEDEQAIQDVIAYNLRREGYEVLLAGHGNEGLALIQSKRPALVILDLMLPGIDGLSVCQQLRADPKTRSIPLMILSAKEEESDIVIGLSLGADDYLAKPFSPREMLARVKALLRRANTSRSVSDDYIQVGPLAIDFSRFEAKLSGQPLKLTATEFKLLAELAGHPGRALTREHLLNRAVGDAVVVVDRNIDVHIRSVRKKLGDQAAMIETVRGLGYRFVE